MPADQTTPSDDHLYQHLLQCAKDFEEFAEEIEKESRRPFFLEMAARMRAKAQIIRLISLG